MLGKYRTGQKVDDANDHADLVALLDRYDQALVSGEPSKTGVGISHFSKQLNIGDKWATAGFHVHRVDGTSDDFSFRRAISDPDGWWQLW